MAGYQWPQGNTHVQLPFALAQQGGTVYDLTGVTTSQITVMYRTVLGNVKAPFKSLNGTVTTIPSPPTAGVFNYQFATTDVANVGQYELLVVINYGGPGNETKSFPIPFQIVATV